MKKIELYLTMLILVYLILGCVKDLDPTQTIKSSCKCSSCIDSIYNLSNNAFDSTKEIQSLWMLENVINIDNCTQEYINEIVPPKINFHAIDSNKHNFNGNNTSNDFWGNYIIINDSINIIIKTTTDLPNTAFDTVFNNALSNVTKFRIINDKLFLYYNEGKKVLILKK